jgi:cysteine desulfurase
LAYAHQSRGQHIIVSAIEHKAILTTAKALEREGFSVTYVPVDTYGLVSAKDVAEALRPDTTVVSIMYANNEVGTIEPIRELVEVCRRAGGDTSYPLFHTDACQAVGMLPVAPRELGVDAMTINSSKIYGPKGIGLLYVRDGVAITPQIVGGDQERGKRAGTENVALVQGFATAVSEAVAGMNTYTDTMHELQSYFISGLQHNLPNVSFNGHPDRRLPNNVHITIPEVEGESLVLLLSEAGICCATGSACSSLDLEPSYVLSAIGQDDDIIHGSLRFSFGNSTTKADLDYTIDTLTAVVKKLRTITACNTEAYQRLHARI